MGLGGDGEISLHSRWHNFVINNNAVNKDLNKRMEE
jgi:hypothetical protein